MRRSSMFRRLPGGRTCLVSSPVPQSCAGVYYIKFGKNEGKWEASCRNHFPQRIMIGVFDTELEACLARVSFEKDNGMTYPSPAKIKLALINNRRKDIRI